MTQSLFFSEHYPKGWAHVLPSSNPELVLTVSPKKIFLDTQNGAYKFCFESHHHQLVKDIFINLNLKFDVESNYIDKEIMFVISINVDREKPLTLDSFLEFLQKRQRQRSHQL